LSVNKITQKIVDQFSRNLVDRLGMRYSVLDIKHNYPKSNSNRRPI